MKKDYKKDIIAIGLINSSYHHHKRKISIRTLTRVCLKIIGRIKQTKAPIKGCRNFNKVSNNYFQTFAL